jgi:polyisoprenyl-teichoic acid--peptidoglycan teichoic acid transferase
VSDFDRRIASNDFSQNTDGTSVDASGPNGTPIPYYVEPGVTPAPLAHRVTILLTGVDFMAGRDHALNDTLLVVSLDTDAGQVAMISVPRDTAGFPLYYGGTSSPTMKINSIQTYVRNHWLRSPDPPMTTLTKEIGYLIGIPVNYYAQIDMDGFVQLIDLVGGVDVVNPTALADDPFYPGWQEPAGPIHLDGKNALIYVRSRDTPGSNDYYRDSRQQDVLIALEKKLANPGMAPQFQQVLGLAGKLIQTNFPLETVKDYTPYVAKFTSGPVLRCVLGQPYSYYVPRSTTGVSTTRLNMDLVANLSVQYFGTESRYYGQAGVAPAPCQSSR